MRHDVAALDSDRLAPLLPSWQFLGRFRMLSLCWRASVLLDAQFSQQSLSISFPVHHDRLDDAPKLPLFQPQTFGFMGTVAHGLEGPQHAGVMGHQAE
jgi:hypothetical protein